MAGAGLQGWRVPGPGRGAGRSQRRAVGRLRQVGADCGSCLRVGGRRRTPQRQATCLLTVEAPAAKVAL